jgi:toxin ParE1/3/4
MNYRLTQRAKADIKEIYRYTVDNFGAVQAGLYLGGLEYTFDLLTGNPRLGLLFAGEIRRYIYKQHYVFYRLEGETIVILQIRHTKRKLPYERS